MIDELNFNINVQKALKLAQNLEDKTYQLKVQKALLASLDSNVDEAKFLELFESVKTQAIQLQDSHSLFEAFSHKSFYFHKKRNYEVEFFTLKAGYKLAKETKDNIGLAMMQVNLARKYELIGDSTSAFDLIKEAYDNIKNARSISKKQQIPPNPSELHLYRYIKRQQAYYTLQYGNKDDGLELFKSLFAEYPEQVIYHLIYAESLLKKGLIDRVKEELNTIEQLILIKDKEQRYEKAHLNLLWADYYRLNNEFEKASLYYLAFSEVEDIYSENWGFEPLLSTAISLDKLGQKEKAYPYYKKYAENILDSHTIKNNQKIAYLSAEFNLKKKEQDLEKSKLLAISLSQKLLAEKNEKVWQLTSLITLLLASIIMIFFSYVKSKQLKYLANTDSLTELSNRRFIMAQLLALVEKSKASQNKFCVAMFDIDHFKSVNDEFGHDVGDNVLKSISTITKQSFRSSDVLGRIGGEEFIIILNRVDIDEAKTLLERFRKKINSYTFDLEGVNRPISISIGVTEFTSFESAESLMKRADIGLYRSKTQGRDCINIE